MTPRSLSEQLKRRPANQEAVDAIKAEMLAALRPPKQIIHKGKKPRG